MTFELKLFILTESSPVSNPGTTLLTKEIAIGPSISLALHIIKWRTWKVNNIPFELNLDTACSGSSQKSIAIEGKGVLPRDDAHVLQTLIRAGWKPTINRETARSLGYPIPQEAQEA